MAGKNGRILSRAAGVLLILLMAVPAVLALPGVQKKIADTVLDRLNRAFEGRIAVSSIRVLPSGSVLLKDLVLLDDHPYTEDIYGCGWERVDTILYAGTVSATFSLRSVYDKDGLHLGRAVIEDAGLHIVSEPAPDGSVSANITRMLGNQEPPEVPVAGPSIFSIRQVRVSNFRFRLTSFLPRRITELPRGINYERLDVVAHELTAHDLKMAGGIMSGVLDRCSMTERSGYHADRISGRARVGMGKGYITDLVIRDQWTDMQLDEFTMTFANSMAFQDFVNKVSMDAKFRPSRISMQTISYFATGALDGNDAVMDVSEMHVTGPVSALNVHKFKFHDIVSEVSGSISGTCTGLPDAQAMVYDVRVDDFLFTLPQLSRFIKSWSMGADVSFGDIAEGQVFCMDATGKGSINALDIDACGHSEAGTFQSRFRLSDVLHPDIPIGIEGRFSTPGIDLGTVLKSELLGKVSLDTDVSALLAEGFPELDIDSLRIDHLEALGHDYSGILASAGLHGGRLSAALNSSDPDLGMHVKAGMDLAPAPQGRRITASGYVDNADLVGMNIMKNRSYATVKMDFNADATIGGDGIIRGYAGISDLIYDNSEHLKEMGDVSILACADGPDQSIRLDSQLFDASYLGSPDFGKIAGDLRSAAIYGAFPILDPMRSGPSGGSHCDVRMKFHETMEYLPIIIPGLYIADRTEAALSMRDDGRLSADLESSRLAIGSRYLKDVRLGIDNNDGRMNAGISASELNIGNHSFMAPSVRAGAADNGFDVKLTFDGTSRGETRGSIDIGGGLRRDEADSLILDIMPRDSWVDTPGGRWSIPASGISLQRNSAVVSNFAIINGNQKIFINGGVNKHADDTLSLWINNFDISLAEMFLDNRYSIDGAMTGSATMTSGGNGIFAMDADFDCDDIAVGGTSFGNLKLTGDWDGGTDEVNVFLRNSIAGLETMMAEGSCNISNRTVAISSTLDKMPINVGAPFLSEVFSEMGGTVSGILNLDGSLDKPVLSSDRTRIEDAMLHLVPTGVKYIVNGPFDVREDGITFDNLTVADRDGGSATLKGSLNHDHLKELSLNARANFRRLLVVDAPESASSAFYGMMKASGSATVTGPLNALQIEADISNTGDGDIHVPLSGSLSGSTSDLLTFKQQEKVKDSYEMMLEQMSASRIQKSTSDTRIKAHVNINPGLNAFLEIDKSVGNVISFDGQGQVNLDIRPLKSQFNLNGDYNISKGKYHFVLPGLMDKDLNIEDGSSVKFGGDLMDSQIDITAKYKLKTSLSTLISDTTTVAARRAVECGLTISDKLRNPSLDFFIDIPDLDPNTKSQVDGALNTVDKVQKQFVALLLMGSFIPSEQSGVFNGTNMLYSNLGEVVSSQFNSILQKLNTPVDLGLGYQSTNSGNNIFDVAISTQLFNDRVEVRGSVGNRTYKSSGSSEDGIVGDLDIDIKLDKPGRFRLTLFSHSADAHTSFLDNTQRNGVGISYQKDYNTLKDLFGGRKTLQQIRRERYNPDENQVIINIHDIQGQTVPDPVPAGGK